MNKVLAIASVVLAIGAAGNAVAGCTTADGSSRIGNLGGIKAALEGKRINAVSPAGEDWKEDHCALSGGAGPGALYKVGAGTKVDPRVKTGTWRVSGSGNDRTVQYAYTGGSTYTWTLWQKGNVIYFCNGSTEIAHTLSIGTAGTPCS